MKKNFFAMVCLMLVALVGTSATMNAEPKKKDKVVVTLNDGTTVEGYIKNDLGSGLKRLFSSSGSIQSFVKVSPAEDGKNAVTYKAKDIKGYRYVDDGTEYESSDYNSAVPFKWNKKTRGLFRVEKRLENGTIYYYQTYVSRGGRNSVSYLVDTYGVKLRGDDRIYNLLVGGKSSGFHFFYSLEKLGPKALSDKYDEYFKDKARVKEMEDDPTVIIRVYDEYLKSNPPINRTEKK